MQNPSYKIDDFFKACKDYKSDLFIWDCAINDAAKYYNLKSVKEIAKYIVTYKLNPDRRFVNSIPLESWRRTDLSAPMVDAYSFNAGAFIGYVAFFYVPNAKWTIKSFHKDTSKETLRVPMFQEKLLPVVSGSSLGRLKGAKT